MSGRSEEQVFLGLGGNIAEPRAAMAQALRLIDDDPDIRVTRVSSLYRTPPWGRTDQPDFLNAVAEIATTLEPQALLERCLDAERRLKRVRRERWGPRAIDIDILIFGARRVREEGLEVPHPRMAERAFVLVPLAEIAPEADVGGARADTCLARLERAGIERIDAPTDWWLQ